MWRGRECRGRGGREQHGIFLAAGFGALPARIALAYRGVIDHAVFFQAAPLPLAPAACYCSCPLQLSASFMHGMRSPHQRTHRDFVQLLFGLKRRGFPNMPQA